MRDREKTPHASFNERMAADWAFKVTSSVGDHRPSLTTSTTPRRGVKLPNSQDSIRSSKRTITVSPWSRITLPVPKPGW